MIPILQDRTEAGAGNCLQACLASVLELPLDAVPDFVASGANPDWFEDLRRWLHARAGLDALLLRLDGARSFTKPAGLFIATGPTAQFGLHSVVCEDDRVVHDPHPSRPPLLSVDYLIVMTVRDPAAARRAHDATTTQP